jgi:hypothetical protein
MAYNPLYGYDTALYGYGQANQLDPSGGGYGPAKRQMPAWMNDLAARGIGVANDGVYGAPPAIDIPRGDGLGGIPAVVAGPVDAGNNGIIPGFSNAIPTGDAAGAGGGAEGSNNGNASFAGSGQGLGLGNPSAKSGWASLLDSLGIEHNTTLGDLSGLGGSQTNNPNVSNMNAVGTAPGDLTAAPGYGFAAGDYTQGASGGVAGGQTGTMSEIAGGGYGAPAGETGAGTGQGFEAPSGFNNYSRGGLVTRNRLQGPDPDGPDDGYGALNVGEGVLTARALKHYGDGIIDRLNKLQVPKKALR